MSQELTQKPRGRHHDDDGWVTVDYGNHSSVMSRRDYEVRGYQPSFDSLPIKLAREVEKSGQERKEPVAEDDVTRRTVDLGALPEKFPTHRHDAVFWESLGRSVATYGFLEEILGKAIYFFTATTPVGELEFDDAYKKWLRTLKKALTDPLGGLIDAYGKAVREHPDATIEHLYNLLSDLRKAATLRNVLCHGSWRAPDSEGASIPLFVDKRDNVFDTPLDCAFLDRVQRHVAELACMVVNSVTHMGWQFPGSDGPGKPIR